MALAYSIELVIPSYYVAKKCLSIPLSRYFFRFVFDFIIMFVFIFVFRHLSLPHIHEFMSLIIKAVLAFLCVVCYKIFFKSIHVE